MKIKTKNTIKKIELHSIHSIIMLFVGLLAGSVGIGIFIQKNPYVRMFDKFFYEAIHHGIHNKVLDIITIPFNFLTFPFLNQWLAYTVVMVTVFLLYLFFKKRELFLWALVSLLVSSGVVYIVTALNWHFIYRERPFVSLPNLADDFSKTVWRHWSSYPSGHARETSLYSTIIASYLPKLKWVLVLFVLFIAWSRLYLGAHYPTDVFAGIGIGYISAKIGLLITTEIQAARKRRTAHKKITKPNDEK